VEFFPVVKVVEIDSVFARAGVIGEAVGAENGLTRVVVVNVTLDGGIEFVDGAFVEPGGVLFHPAFELAIGGLALFNVVNDRVTIEADAVDDHLVVAVARAGITGSKFADRL
jgi:hypothetical protein